MSTMAMRGPETLVKLRQREYMGDRLQWKQQLVYILKA